MRITSKGQVTVPKSVREKLGLQPGDDVGFSEDGQAVYVHKVELAKKPNAGEELYKQLVGRGPALRQGRPMMTAEEVNELTRGRPLNAIDPD